MTNITQIIIETEDGVVCKIERTERKYWNDDKYREATKNKTESHYRTIQKYYIQVRKPKEGNADKKGAYFER